MDGSNVKCKTDRDDALKLARMAAMNELKAVHMPSEEHREFRSLVKYRKTLDQRVNKMKNTIRAWISGKQKTRKKKAAVALALKIAVIAWALLRDEKDWEPKRMIEVTESFGKMSRELKELDTMQPKENSDQRKSRLRREAREARAAALNNASTSQAKSQTKQPGTVPSKHKTRVSTHAPQATSSTPKPRQARKPVSAG